MLHFERFGQFAYTNDKNEIRHGLIGETSVDFRDSKFFLISCSAFKDYLIENRKDKLINLVK